MSGYKLTFEDKKLAVLLGANEMLPDIINDEKLVDFYNWFSQADKKGNTVNCEKWLNAFNEQLLKNCTKPLRNDTDRDLEDRIEQTKNETELIEVLNSSFKPQKSSKQKYLDILSKYNVESNKVDPTKKLTPPKVAISIKNTSNDNYATIGTLGDFSLWTGKAKVGKSYVMRIAVVSALKSTLHLNRFKSDLTEDKRKVLIIDTEQSDYHLNLGIKRICKEMGKVPENLQAYGFRGTPHDELKEIVEALIYTTDNLGLVIIDGIVDLIANINNEDIAKEMSTTIGRWTKDCQIHIMAVLHENKGKTDNNARGSIGTWLTNKAETVMNVSNCEDKDTKRVQAIETRNAAPEDFYFKINDSGDVEEVDAPQKTTKQKTPRPDQLSEIEQQRIVKEVFTIPLNATNSIDSLILHFQVQNVNVLTGRDGIKRYLQYLVTQNYLTKIQGLGKDSKSTFYSLHSRLK
jgi:hypothetical protein